MWFKNLVVYKLAEDYSLSAAELEERLSRRLLQPCVGFELQTRGWVAPRGDGRYVHTLGSHQLLALGIHQKLLPASIVKQATEERAAQIALEQGHPVGRRQMREIR